ncbi:MAG TPA: helix-turn-helix domain-containing protein [Pseudogracilibacillus sp.]|nr:helix-turn-helix domain-containing protein [Pseudogracilibacillus sp.]
MVNKGVIIYLTKIIGIKEAAEITTLSPSTIKKYCENNYFPAKKINQTWIIDKPKLINWLKIKVIFETINNNYEANSENGMSVDLYHNKQQLLTSLSGEDFQQVFKRKLEHIHFPIITFTQVHSLDNQLFESFEKRTDILQAAQRYFKETNQYKVWEFRDYTVYEKENFLKFVSNQSEILGFIYNDLTTQIKALNRGIDPIEKNWILYRKP